MPTLLHGDNLAIMRGMDSNSVDLVYLDPPMSMPRSLGAPTDRLSAEIVNCHPVIAVAQRSYGGGVASFLSAMLPRLTAIRRVLKQSGSLYLHCDPRTSHYLKLLLDDVFGEVSFRNEIIWQRSSTNFLAKWRWGETHDVILFYVGDRATWNGTALIDTITDIPSLKHSSDEQLGYPTQKPVALLERIIAASSNEGDIVLDPFCGCGTALMAASNLGRDWIGIDANADSVEVCRKRLLLAGTEASSS